MAHSDLNTTSWIVAAGRGDRRPGDPSNVPPMPASNYHIGSDRTYVRNESSPTWEALEQVIGGLEGGAATAWASGMAAVAGVVDQVPAGGIVVLPDDCYQGVTALVRRHEAAGRLQVRVASLTDVPAWHAAMKDASLVWLETPSNPEVTVADLPAICAGERPADSLIAVDNTFATPLGQRPLEVGADIVMHSATKYIGGHSDLLAGMTITNRDEVQSQLRTSRSLGGATPGMMEAWLATRGVRTLAVRLERATANAQALAEWLHADPRVGTVRYPGLPSHPTHDIAVRTLDSFGAIVSFDLADAAAADAACSHVELIMHATSLGGVESCMERRGVHPGQEHLPPGLIRLSVGIEDPDDLIADLDRSFG